ncbi:hypothetical protein BU183_09230, partial [Enterococcus faecium]
EYTYEGQPYVLETDDDL